jgi:hypothetical protein
MENNLLSVLEHGAEAVESRRNALAFVGKLGAGALFSMLPFGLADEAKAQSAGNDVAILNYALTLEYLESSFYNQYATDAVITTAAVRPLFATIKADEAKHVAFLRTAISGAGATPVMFTNADFDFTAGGSFTPTDFATFLILSQAFEDTGVRAYKGQAANITDKGILTAALNIHSVEARHAAAVRKVRGLMGWVTDAAESPAPIQPVYGAGQARTGATADMSPAETNLNGLSPVSGRYTAAQIQQAFDEPLGTSTVKNIADPFVIPSLG